MIFFQVKAAEIDTFPFAFSNELEASKIKTLLATK